MSLDAALVQRLSASIAQALAQAVAPLQEEVERLRHEVALLRHERNGGDSTAPARRPAVTVPLRAVPAERAAVTARRGQSSESACRVPRCEAAVLAKELCETHYRIMRRAASQGERFDPAKQRPAAAKPVARACGEPGCDDGHYARGLCRRHYMTLRARERAAERSGVAVASDEEAPRPKRGRPPIELVRSQPAPAATVYDRDDDDDDVVEAPRSASGQESAARAELMNGMPFFELAVGGDPGVVAMPTAEAVIRVLNQYRGGLGKVAEVLGRNRQTLMDLLGRLNLLEYTVTMRKRECERIVRSSLRERIADVLFREKLLEDLKCLKEVDEQTSTEIHVRCAQLVKICSTQEEALARLAQEYGLEEAGMKRLTWRFKLRQHLGALKSTRPAPSRARV